MAKLRCNRHNSSCGTANLSRRMGTKEMNVLANRETVFSDCRKFRYTLWRTWNPVENPTYAMFIGLNPSTADETNDDPTVRRCIRFSKDWGYGALCMTNIFAYRATDPYDMKAQRDPVGSQNDFWLRNISAKASVVIAAWGVHGEYLGRGKQVFEMLPSLQCLGTTVNGQPRHPLYLRAVERPRYYTACGV